MGKGRGSDRPGGVFPLRTSLCWLPGAGKCQEA